MKKIIQYLKDYSKLDHHWGYISFLLLFTGTFIALYYGSDTFPKLRESLIWKPQLFFYYGTLYGLPIVVSYLAFIISYKRWDLLKNKKFWLIICFAVLVFTMRSCTHLLTDSMLGRMRHWTHSLYWFRNFQALLRGLMIMVPIILFWYFSKNRDANMYGFTLKGFDTKPYFTMLLIMLPLITLASLNADFLGQYPRAGLWGLEDFTLKDKSHWKYFGLFEFIYGLDFISIEFFFRGFLIIALIKYVGPHVVLPMAVFYVFIHFGKPMGETISSFFGGSLLGIISFYSRSIFGGIIVHMGIAWLMELGALISKLNN